MTPEATPVDGGDAEAYSVPDDGEAERPQLTGLRSMWSAKPGGWDSPSRESAGGRMPDAGEPWETGPLPAVVRTG